MITIHSTKIISGEDVQGDVTVVHPPLHVLLCEDKAGNQFEIETNKDTFVQVTDFLYKLEQV